MDMNFLMMMVVWRSLWEFESSMEFW